MPSLADFFFFLNFYSILLGVEGRGCPEARQDWGLAMCLWGGLPSALRYGNQSEFSQRSQGKERKDLPGLLQPGHHPGQESV